MEKQPVKLDLFHRGYFRVSYKAPAMKYTTGPDSFKDLNEKVSNECLRRIYLRLTEIQTEYNKAFPKLRPHELQWRIVNVSNPIDERVTSDRGIPSAENIVHIEYWLQPI